MEYILLLIVFLLTSCEKEQLSTDGDKWPISYGYMQFSTGVCSRNSLATDLYEKNFGVLGYKYSTTTNWSAAKPLATPLVFYNQEVVCNTNGICTYDADATQNGNQPKPWENNVYSFFAYHPYNGAGINLSSSDKTNTPTLTYSYGWLNPTNQDQWYYNNVINACHNDIPIYDLMTAEAIDINGSGEGRVVLNFKHRLYAFEVLANNYNENSEGTTDARQQITNLELTLEGLVNTSMTIPLSMQDGEAAPVYNGTAVGTRTFKISEESVMVPAFNETTDDGRGAGVATSISQLGSRDGGYLMLIPQKGTNSGIKGTLSWAELSNFSGDVSTEFTSTIDFEPGKLYQIYINFVGSGITIALIEAGAWDVLDVTHKFE